MTLTWDPPGKGDWHGLHDHFPRAVTPELHDLLADGMTTGGAVWCERYGLPVRSLLPGFVNGRVYITTAPLLGKPTNTVPPAVALKVAIALVPAFRRRARAAARAVDERPWNDEAKAWFDQGEPEWRSRNEALQAVDPGALDDAALIEHLQVARATVGDGYRTHFALHGCDLVPTGMLLVRSLDWGLDPVAVAGLLAGWSAASRGDESLPDWCLVTGYDFDGRCVIELPERLRHRDGHHARRPVPQRDHAIEDAIRSTVPEGDRPEFDRLLADARTTYGVRDTNGLLTAAWPAGLLRRAMLEAGRRLAARGLLHDAEHAVELRVTELADLLRRGAASPTSTLSPTAATAAAPDGPTPTADEAAGRLAERLRLSVEPAPASLGPPQQLPLHALPPAMRTLASALLGLRNLEMGATPAPTTISTTAVSTDAPAGSSDTRSEEPGSAQLRGGDLRGVGLWTAAGNPEKFMGKACVTRDPVEALQRFEPGDVIVTAGTCPAWNQILALAGAVVTEDGGPLSHAAVIARELGLPAVIGCTGATAHIPDGATIELHIPTGTVTLV